MFRRATPKIAPGKYREVTELVRRGCSWDNTISPEIAKCQLLCANCHVKRTKIQIEERKTSNFVIQKRKRFYPKDPDNVKVIRIHKRGDPPPERNEFYLLVKTYSFTYVGKMYGVTATTVQEWCQKMKIPNKRRKLMEELENE